MLLDGVRDVEVSLQRPHTDPLAARLSALPEEDRPAAGSRKPDLLLEFSVGGVERVFVGPVFALRDGPGGLVLARPERPTRVRDQDLDGVPGGDPVQQKACTGRAHGLRPSFHPATEKPRAAGSPSGCSPSKHGRTRTPARGRDPPTRTAVARLSSRSGGPGRSHLGGTGFGRNIRPHVFQLHSAMSPPIPENDPVEKGLHQLGRQIEEGAPPPSAAPEDTGDFGGRSGRKGPARARASDRRGQSGRWSPEGQAG